MSRPKRHLSEPGRLGPARFAAGWVLAQAILVALAMTWPVIRQLDLAPLGSPHGDNIKHLWTLWWIRQSLAEDQVLPLATQYLNYPVGLELWPIEPLNGLIATLTSFLPLVSAANLIVLINLTLTGWMGSLWCWELTRSRLAACFGGLLLETCSFSAFAVQVGVGELQHMWLLLLCLWATQRLTRDPGWGRAIALAGLLLLTISCSFYLGFFSVCAVFLLGAWALFQRDRPPLLSSRLGLVLALTVGLGSLPVFGFASSYRQVTEIPAAEQVRAPDTQGPRIEPAEARLELHQLFHEQRAVEPGEVGHLQAYGGGRIVGLPILILVVLGIRQRGRDSVPWLVIGGFGVVMACGSTPSFGDEALGPDGTLLLPFGLLNTLIHAASGTQLHFPTRFLLLTQVATIALAVWGTRALRGRRAFIGAALVLGNVVDVSVRQLVPIPLQAQALPDVSALAALAERPRGGLVNLDLIWRPARDNRHAALIAQTFHQQPIHAVPIERIDTFAQEGTTLVSSLLLAEHLDPLYQGLPLQPMVVDHRGDRHRLWQAGFRYLMVSDPERLQSSDPQQLPGETGQAQLPPGLLDALDDIFGPALLSGPGLVVHTIEEPPASEQDRLRWAAFYAERQDRVRTAGGLEHRQSSAQTDPMLGGTIPSTPTPPSPSQLPREPLPHP